MISAYSHLSIFPAHKSNAAQHQYRQAGRFGRVTASLHIRRSLHRYRQTATAETGVSPRSKIECAVFINENKLSCAFSCSSTSSSVSVAIGLPIDHHQCRESIILHVWSAPPISNVCVRTPFAVCWIPFTNSPPVTPVALKRISFPSPVHRASIHG